MGMETTFLGGGGGEGEEGLEMRNIENIRQDTDAISLSHSDLSLVPSGRLATDITGQTLHPK